MMRARQLTSKRIPEPTAATSSNRGCFNYCLVLMENGATISLHDLIVDVLRER